MSVTTKLRLNARLPLYLIDAPDGYASLFSEFQVNTSLTGTQPINQLLVFVRDMKSLNAQIPAVLKHLANDSLLWIAYPKKSGAIKSDITRDNGWEALGNAGYDGVSLVAIDNDWSAGRFKKKPLRRPNFAIFL